MRTFLAISIGLAAAVTFTLAFSHTVALAGPHDSVAQSRPSGDANVALAAKATALLDKCSACHNHGWEQSGKPKVTWGRDVPRLIKDGLVVPGKPDESRLYRKVRGGNHPKRNWATAEDFKAFADWISQGCPAPAAHSASQPATSHSTSSPAGH